MTRLMRQFPAAFRVSRPSFRALSRKRLTSAFNGRKNRWTRTVEREIA